MTSSEVAVSVASLGGRNGDGAHPSRVASSWISLLSVVTNVLIIEGLFIIHFPEIARLIDLKVFIDTCEEVAFERRLKRDLAERDYSEEAITYKWHNHVLPSYREFLEPYKSTCEKLIGNNEHTPGNILKAAEEISAELRKTILRESF